MNRVAGFTSSGLCEGLRRYAVSRGSRPEDADDVVQEAIYRALMHFDGSTAAPLEAWLRLVVARLVVDQQRLRLRQERVMSRLGCGSGETAPMDPFEEIAERALAAGARALVERLSPVQKDVLLAVAGGESVAEIAQRTGRTLRSVEGHLRRARKILRAHLDS